MKVGAKKTSQKIDALITKSGRCGAPLDLKKAKQLSPVAAIARALNIKNY